MTTLHDFGGVLGRHLDTLDEGPRPRRSKVRCSLHDIVLEGNKNGLNQDMKLKGKLMFWRIILKSRVQGRALAWTLRVEFNEREQLTTSYIRTG